MIGACVALGRRHRALITGELMEKNVIAAAFDTPNLAGRLPSTRIAGKASGVSPEASLFPDEEKWAPKASRPLHEPPGPPGEYPRGIPVRVSLGDLSTPWKMDNRSSDG